MIQVDVAHPLGTWRASDPSLLTFEVQELALWLEEVHANSNNEPSCYFIEWNLSLQIEESGKGAKILRIYFENELRPKWASRITFQENLFVDFPCEHIDFRVAAKELLLELQQYPQHVFRI